MAERLKTRALNSAIAHLRKWSDTDLFPRPFEIEALYSTWPMAGKFIEATDLGAHQWSASSRRAIIPKDRLGYRVGMQLDPIDSLVLTALIYQYGRQIERTRVKTTENIVFSYRLRPLVGGQLYDPAFNWAAFWQRSLALANESKVRHVLVADVSDYYNQVYPHTVEQQLARANLPREVVRCFLNLLKSTTQTVSRGIPIGPHGAHLLAEAAFDPIDRSVLATRRPYCRYLDDLHIGCRDEVDVDLALQQLADILDKQQRLVVQRHKVRSSPSEQFIRECQARLLERPVNRAEARLLDIVHSQTDDPYATVSLHDLDPSDATWLGKPALESVLAAYLRKRDPEFSRLRWFMRRLAQTGSPNAIEYVVKNLYRLRACIGEVAKYLLAATRHYDKWGSVGNSLLRAADHPYVRGSEYLTTILIDLFGRNGDLDHIEAVLSRYDSSTPMVRRKIVLAAAAARSDYWIRLRKNDWGSADPWLRRAIIAGSRVLVKDERNHWLNHVLKGTSPLLDCVVANWAKSFH